MATCWQVFFLCNKKRKYTYIYIYIYIYIYYVVRRQPYTLNPGKFVLAPKTWLFTVVKFRKGNVMEGDLSTAFAIDIIRNSSPLKKIWFHVKANYLRSNGPNDFSSTTIYEEEYSVQTDAYRLPLLVFTLFVFSFLGTPHSALRKIDLPITASSLQRALTLYLCLWWG